MTDPLRYSAANSGWRADRRRSIANLWRPGLPRLSLIYFTGWW